MILIAELIFILVLIIALIMLLREESKIKKLKVARGTAKEYWNGWERRQAIRIDTSLPIRYSVKKESHNKLNGQMKDVSSSGMRLLINEKLTKGTPLLLEFDLPTTKGVIGAEGEVIWSDGKFTNRDEIGRRLFHTGIQFVNIKLDDKNKLLAYIKRTSEIPKKR